MDDDGSTPATYNVVCDYFLSNLYSGTESTFPEEHVRLSHLASATKHQNWDYAICHVTAASGGNLHLALQLFWTLISAIVCLHKSSA